MLDLNRPQSYFLNNLRACATYIHIEVESNPVQLEGRSFPSGIGGSSSPYTPEGEAAPPMLRLLVYPVWFTQEFTYSPEVIYASRFMRGFMQNTVMQITYNLYITNIYTFTEWQL